MSFNFSSVSFFQTGTRENMLERLKVEHQKILSKENVDNDDTTSGGNFCQNTFALHSTHWISLLLFIVSSDHGGKELTDSQKREQEIMARNANKVRLLSQRLGDQDDTNESTKSPHERTKKTRQRGICTFALLVLGLFARVKVSVEIKDMKRSQRIANWNVERESMWNPEPNWCMPLDPKSPKVNVATSENQVEVQCNTVSLRTYKPWNFPTVY